MVRLQILSGRRAGARFESTALPVIIGRSEEADFSLEEPGVWPSHCKIQWRSEGLVLEVEPGALVSVNDISAPHAVLRDGDKITLGGVTLRFGFSPVRQSGATLREWLTWIGLAALCLAQVAVVYWLNR